MRDRNKSEEITTDQAYISDLITKQLPPSLEDIRRSLSLLRFQNCMSAAARREVRSSVRSVPQHNSRQNINVSEFVFLSMRSIVSVFDQLGYDIRPVFIEDPCDILQSIRNELRNVAKLPEQKPSGATVEIDGQYGIILSRTWLRSAGIDLDAQTLKSSERLAGSNSR